MSTKNSINIKGHIQNFISQGFFHILLGGTLTKIIAFLSSIIIVRFVSKEDYAFLAYADNLFGYIYLFACFGLDTAVLKFCIEDDKRRNKGYLIYALRMGLFLEVLLLFGFIMFIMMFPIAFEESRSYLYALLLYPVFYFFLCIIQAFMRARLRNKEYAYIGIIQTVIVLIVSLSFVWIINAYSVVLARYTALIVVLIYGVFVIKQEIIAEDVIYPSKEEKRRFLVFGFSLLIANVFSMIMPINEGFLVNNLIRDTTATANYKVASMIPENMTFITSSIITFYFPFFAKLKDKNEIWAKSKRVGVFNGAIIASVAVVGAILSPYIIRLAYGTKYDDATGLMTLMWIIHSINAGVRMLPMNILPAIGYTKFNVVLSVVTCGIHLLIDYVLISAFGVNGAAIAGGTVYLLTGVAYWVYLKKRLR